MSTFPRSSKVSVSPVVRGAMCLFAVCMLALGSQVKAAPVTPAGFNDDTGVSYFTPGDVVLGIELLDAIDPLSEFGFYYQGSPTNLIPIFDGADVGPGQLAGIDFVGGSVQDIDSGGPATIFNALGGDIGFYLTIDNALTIYSDPTLNVLLGGTDLFFAFQNASIPLQYALFFEGDLGNGILEDISFNLVSPLTASVIPLPPTVYLMGSLIPILMFMSRRRRKALGS